MTTQPKQQENDEISLIDILLFLKVSSRNVLLSTVVCLMVGVAYLLAAPKIYEVSATIKMALVAGEVVESPEILLEKIKLPLFFSDATMRICGSDGELSSQGKFADKLKPTLNKSAPLISLSARANSTHEARACLEAAIGEIQKSQNELAKFTIEQKKRKLTTITEQLIIEENKTKNFLASMALNNNLLGSSNFYLHGFLTNRNEVNDLRRQISLLEEDLIPPRTQTCSLVNPMYAPEVTVEKSPSFILGLFLALGVVLGLLITGLMRVASEIRRQIRDNEDRFH